ncbi:MAG TPA: NAD-dependent epimerase/dehydratase family protein [Saprospiraceae bacterium]|nr:NAD-dependent epimerase/dehydratase family protein [Saprospiraceae bacterium]
MVIHLITGACGFVGRNMVKRLLRTTDDVVFMVDDLSAGIHPSLWFPDYIGDAFKDLEILDSKRRFYFLKDDFRKLLYQLREDPNYIQKEYQLSFEQFSDVFHFAAIVGGRAKIDGDPMMVALDLSIDAEFFYWLCKHPPKRILYPSSSAAYPVSLQGRGGSVALKESDIDFHSNLGMPDMTYGWSKMTGEYLAQIAARHYGLNVVCIRPFSGYGEDQDLTYPIPAIAARAARKEDPFEVWGTGEQARDFVHIDDVLDFIFILMNHVSDGSGWNIGSGHLTSFLQIIELMTGFAGYKPSIKKLLDKPVGVHARYADMSLVYNRFGWKPKISLIEGMGRVYEAARTKLSIT